jgi:orotate phosphoribosyltransferase
MIDGFIQADFDNFIIGQNIIGFKDQPIKLKSGRESYFYVNWRPVTGTVNGNYLLSNYILKFAKSKGLEPNCYYGVPAGATGIGTITQYRWALSHEDFLETNYPIVIGRENPKDHGDPADKYFVGNPKGDTVVIEDVVTTGGSLIKELGKLKDAKVSVEAVIVLTDRNELRKDGLSVGQAVEDLGMGYYAMSNALELLPIVYQRQKPGEITRRKIEEEFAEFGVRPLKII